MAELEPLLAVATNVLVPVLNNEDPNVLLLAALPDSALPLRVQVTRQLASLGVTEKRFEVAPAAAIR